MATDWAVSALASRPETVSVEVRLMLTVPASERAVAVLTVIVRFWAAAPAASSPRVVEVRPARVELPTAVRLSWRAASVRTAFSTATVRVTAGAPTCRKPKPSAVVSTTPLA